MKFVLPVAESAMSQKNHARPSRNSNNKKFNTSSLLLLGGIALVAIAIVAFVWISLAPSSGGGAPQIQVDNERIDFGKQPFERPVRATFQIRNTGKGTLTLSVPRVATLLEGC